MQPHRRSRVAENACRTLLVVAVIAQAHAAHSTGTPQLTPLSTLFAGTADDIPAQRSALLELQSSTGGSTWRSSHAWNQSLSYCMCVGRQSGVGCWASCCPARDPCNAPASSKQKALPSPHPQTPPHTAGGQA